MCSQPHCVTWFTLYPYSNWRSCYSSFLVIEPMQINLVCYFFVFFSSHSEYQPFSTREIHSFQPPIISGSPSSPTLRYHWGTNNKTPPHLVRHYRHWVYISVMLVPIRNEPSIQIIPYLALVRSNRYWSARNFFAD